MTGTVFLVNLLGNTVYIVDKAGNKIDPVVAVKKILCNLRIQVFLVIFYM